MNKHIYYIIFLLLITSCHPRTNNLDGDKKIKDTTLSKNFDSIDKEIYKKHCVRWRYYTKKNDFNKLIKEATPVFLKNKDTGDVLLSAYAAAYLSQACLFTGQYKNLDYYLNYTFNYLDETNDRDYFLVGLINNVAAIDAMKRRFDYPSALVYLKKALESTETSQDTLNRITLLCNIASIYQSRKDTLGIQYAIDAYKLSKLAKDTSLQIYSLISLSSIEEISSDYRQASEYAKKAISLSNSSIKYNNQKPSTYLNYAEILSASKRYDKAKDNYELALENIKYSNKHTKIQIYISYAQLLYINKEYEKSINLLLEAKKMTSELKDIENTHTILLGLAEGYNAMNKTAEALPYYKEYIEINNNIFNFKREQEFNNLLLQYEQTKHREEINYNKLRLAKKNNIQNIYIFIIVIVCILLISSFILIKKKNEMYKSLVQRYELYRKQIDDIKNKETLKNNETSKVMLKLYQDLEKSLKVDKIYREKEISMSQMAEILGTNTTYLSKIINQYYEKSFHNVINEYRIKDCIVYLSDPLNEEPLKLIFDRAGYISLTTAYRSFQKETGCTPSKYRSEIKKSANS